MAIAATHNSLNVLSILAAPFNWYGRICVKMAENSRYAKNIEFLTNLSDEQLSERGIKREDIPSHAFGHLYYL